MTPSTYLTVAAIIEEIPSYALNDVCAMNLLTVTSGDQSADIAIVLSQSNHSMIAIEIFLTRESRLEGTMSGERLTSKFSNSFPSVGDISMHSFVSLI